MVLYYHQIVLLKQLTVTIGSIWYRKYPIDIFFSLSIFQYFSLSLPGSHGNKNGRGKGKEGRVSERGGKNVKFW